MGVTTGSLTAIEQQVITIKIPGTLTREQADEFAAALNQLVDEFNASHSTGAPRILVA
jgi:hypothetical protein